MRPSWSSDGKKLIFEVGQEMMTGGGHIGAADETKTVLYMMNTVGTGLARLPIPQGSAPAGSR